MKKATPQEIGQADLPKGIRKVTSLPDGDLSMLWQSIILDKKIKERLLAQAASNFTIRGVISRTVLPLHGLVLLVGAPGTGKTSMARGLASRVADLFPKAGFRLVEVEPHSLTSSALGKTQKAVLDLFSQSISELSAEGPVVVLLDEVETLAVDRSRLSLEANPIDVHRATDAVLVQLDALADERPNILFIATSNFPQAIDDAFRSRCDLVVEVPLPERDACDAILRHSIKGVAEKFAKVAQLLDATEFAACVEESVGLDGRAIRKAVANSLAVRAEVAINPNKVTPADLLQALRDAKSTKGAK